MCIFNQNRKTLSKERFFLCPQFVMWVDVRVYVIGKLLITTRRKVSAMKCIVCLYAVDMLTAFERGLSTKECDSHKWHKHTIRDGHVIVACSECGVDEERMWK
jgi:hypothetical protein